MKHVSNNYLLERRVVLVKSPRLRGADFFLAASCVSTIIVSVKVDLTTT